MIEMKKIGGEGEEIEWAVSIFACMCVGFGFSIDKEWDIYRVLSLVETAFLEIVNAFFFVITHLIKASKIIKISTHPLLLKTALLRNINTGARDNTLILTTPT